MLKKFQGLVQGRKTDKIRKEFLKLIEKSPKDTRTRLKLGDLYVKENRIPEAVEQYIESAEIFAKAEFHLKAIALYKQILKFQPKSIMALRRIAQISYQYGLYADAYPFYEKVAKLLLSQETEEEGQVKEFGKYYKEVSQLRLKDTKQRLRIFEAIFPSIGGTYPEPYDSLCQCAVEIGRDDQGLEDALLLARWLSAFIPEELKASEILVALLHKAGHRGEQQKVLEKLEMLYKTTEQEEEKKDFLQKYRVEPSDPGLISTSPEILRSDPEQMEEEPSDQVKIKMEANIYDLLKQKSMNQPADEGLNSDSSPLERLEFNDLFDSFKQGIEGQISKDDYETHYNLGIAYQEMGLYEEAIHELQMACKDPSMMYDSYFLMANCARDLQCLEDALNFYEKALVIENLNEDQIRGVRYEQALTFRILGRNVEALQIFQEIDKEESNYRETAQQIEELQSNS